MKFKDLYEKSLERRVNPAVSASDLNEETVKTEIDEYVFTPEIISNLYKILSNVKCNGGDHVGIWINGYYGSGKSHFLKYTSYCLSSKYAEHAFSRLIEAAQEISKEDDLELMQAGVDINELKALKDWYANKADVEMVMFNIGDVHDVNSNQNTAFTSIFWNQFNARRGYNSVNLALAQYLEKALDDDGKFGEFKDLVSQNGFDWERNISRFAAGRIDMALEMAKTVDPDLAIDAIRQRVINNEINVSVESFANELKEYLDKKNNRNHRIMFFVDEVSQFIDDHKDLILQLQSLVERLDKVCESKVWIACTAQQSLETVVQNAGGNISNPNDAIGKILGRFEVRASLQGTKPEYITQRRILEKNGQAEIDLKNLFKADKAKLDAQFVLPTSYRSYRDGEDFAAYYPFVPYQFQLIMKVLDSFEKMNFVDKQVRGNERSLINITFSIAKETAECEVGEFIPFDRFFGVEIQGSMQHFGQMAIANARQAVQAVTDRQKQQFYTRVVNVLFMICNLSDVDKQTFSATIDNVVTLLMTRIDANKAVIKDEVNEVLQYLMDKSVIRKIKTDTGTEIYNFYTQEESEVAELIKNQPVDSNTYSDELYRIISGYFNMSNKETYATRNFSVGANVDGRSYLANNADIVVDFLTTSSSDTPVQYSLVNADNHLVFFLCPQWKEQKGLRNSFIEYCRVQRFAQEPAVSEERQRTKRMFLERAKEMYSKEIVPKFNQLLETCPIISGQSALAASEIGASRGKEHYRSAINFHIDRLYPYAQIVNNTETPRSQNELSTKILRPVEATLVQKPLSQAEEQVNDYLDRQIHDVTVADVMRAFSKVPYGWSEFATVYTLNELVRRHLYTFNYNNIPNVSRETTARNIVKDATRFTIEKARAIPQELINNFIAAWEHIFNVTTIPGGNDSTELYRNCKETDDSELNRLHSNYKDLYRKLASCPFVDVIDQAISLMDDWLKIRDHREFFETIINAKDSASTLFDRCKRIRKFADEQFDKYREILQFIKDNDGNFEFLSPEHQDIVRQLDAVKTDMEPWNNIPAYNKMMRNLNSELTKCRQGLVEQIASNYNKVFDDLDEYAKSVKVSSDKYARRDATISTKTSSRNFWALKAANADAKSFFSEQLEKINKAIVVVHDPEPDYNIKNNMSRSLPLLPGCGSARWSLSTRALPSR